MPLHTELQLHIIKIVLTINFVKIKIKLQINIGASPSGKAAGFGPAISEVRILPPQINRIESPFDKHIKGLSYVIA